jgi:hypothetical protein
MHDGRNPTRRNRNIGTAKQGHGQENRLKIPRIGDDGRKWSEQLNPHERHTRIIGGKEILFIREQTTSGHVHACSIADVEHILSHLAQSDWAGIHTIVFRQSTRKQRIVSPAWGRMFYYSELGVAGRRTIHEGPVIVLEAYDPSAKFEWSNSLDSHDAAELDELRSDGHQVTREGNKSVIRMTGDSIRSTQLYRTLVHEIGHWFDWLDKVETPAARGGDLDVLVERFFQRPPSEREAFAHHYARGARQQLEQAGIIPFAARVDRD